MHVNIILSAFLVPKLTAENGDSITVVLLEWVKHMLCAFLELIDNRRRVHPAALTTNVGVCPFRPTK